MDAWILRGSLKGNMSSSSKHAEAPPLQVGLERTYTRTRWNTRVFESRNWPAPCRSRFIITCFENTGWMMGAAICPCCKHEPQADLLRPEKPFCFVWISPHRQMVSTKEQNFASQWQYPPQGLLSSEEKLRISMHWVLTVTQAYLCLCHRISSLTLLEWSDTCFIYWPATSKASYRSTCGDNCASASDVFNVRMHYCVLFQIAYRSEPDPDSEHVCSLS